MPSPSDFRKAFGLEVGAKLGTKFEITSSHLGHEVKEQNERYEFPTTLELEWIPGTRAAGKKLGERRHLAQDAFRHQCRLDHIVYSAYGSPYSCCFAGPAKQPNVTASSLDEEGKRFHLVAKGVAVRRRDVPTRAQVKQQEREAAGVPAAVSAEDTQRYLKGCRVIKSRFGTSKCSVCDEIIDPGVQIAKPKGEEGRGGWAHALCIVAKAKGEGGSKGEKAVGGEAAEESEEAETEKPDSSKRKRGSGGGKAAAAAASGGRGRRQRRRVSEE